MCHVLKIQMKSTSYIHQIFIWIVVILCLEFAKLTTWKYYLIVLTSYPKSRIDAAISLKDSLPPQIYLSLTLKNILFWKTNCFTEQLQRLYRHFLYSHHPTSSHFNILYNHSLIIKSKILTLVKVGSSFLPFFTLLEVKH